MKQKLISEESSFSFALVWQKVSKEEQHKVIDLITNLICDYYFSQKEGDINDAYNRRK